MSILGGLSDPGAVAVGLGEYVSKADVVEALLMQLDEWQPPHPEQSAYWAGYSKALSDVRRWATGGDQ